MLLQRLSDLADRLDDVPPPGYAYNNVRYEIHLDMSGRLLTDTPVDLASKENKGGQKRAVPSKKRPGTQPDPLLVADHAEFVFGRPRVPDETVKAQARHVRYMELLRQCAEVTNDPAVAAVHQFLSAQPLEKLKLDDAFVGTGTIEFVVDGQRVTERPAVRSFWADLVNDDEDTRIMQCIVCQQTRPALKRLRGVLKGLRNGNPTGTNLISANSNAFESYGLEASHTAPICAECAERFTNALNHLLATRTSRLDIGDVTYVFWAKEETGFAIAGWFDAPDPAEVRALINSVRTGSYDETLDPTAYYVLALTANNARAVVRDWLDTTVGGVKRHLGLWFLRQAIVGNYGEEPEPLKLYSLAAATVRDAKKELSSQTTVALLRAALTGSPVPNRLLQQAVRRCQISRDVTRPQAALIKLALLSNNPQYPEDSMIELQTDHPEAAYHCGRLLAVLEAIQRLSADGQLNTTLVDRFYGTASSAPASVFGTLLRGAQPHITKLRKNKPGLAVRLEQELEEVIAALEQFPPTLTVKQQALFALGYYHQRAADRARAKEISKQRAAAPQATATLESIEREL
jgi:CRISPR-associated protein Csd1